jgi:acyl-CoA thioesterase-2
MQSAVDELVNLLDLEAIEVNIFRGVSPDDDRQRVFGGQVAGQALVAAARTVDGRSVHSLHAYFLRPGDPATPIIYEVDRIRDGRSFTTRRVIAIQNGRAIFSLAASFQRHEEGFDHHSAMPADLAPPDAVAAAPGDFAIDVRYLHGSPLVRGTDGEEDVRVWLRADGRLPDDPVLHMCIFTYASDLTLLDTAVVRHGTGPLNPGLQMASLDHAMWFHRPFRVDAWLLYDQQSPSASNGRGLATGSVFTKAGELVVSVVQEGLIRTARD